MSDKVHLILKHRWYDMIESGEKLIEYRDATEFYRKRLFGKKYVVLHRGYTSTVITFKIVKIQLSKNHTTYELYLGERVE